MKRKLDQVKERIVKLGLDRYLTEKEAIIVHNGLYQWSMFDSSVEVATVDELKNELYSDWEDYIEQLTEEEDN